MACCARARRVASGTADSDAQLRGRRVIAASRANGSIAGDSRSNGSIAREKSIARAQCPAAGPNGDMISAWAFSAIMLSARNCTAQPPKRCLPGHMTAATLFWDPGAEKVPGSQAALRVRYLSAIAPNRVWGRASPQRILWPIGRSARHFNPFGKSNGQRKASQGGRIGMAGTVGAAGPPAPDACGRGEVEVPARGRGLTAAPRQGQRVGRPPPSTPLYHCCGLYTAAPYREFRGFTPRGCRHRPLRDRRRPARETRPSLRKSAGGSGGDATASLWPATGTR